MIPNDLTWTQIIRAATMLGLKPEEKSKAGAMLVNARLRAEIEAGRVEKIKRGRYRLTGGLS